MSTKETIQKIAVACLERLDNCPDYSRKGKKGQDMALNYFCGAASLAKVQGNDELVNHLTKVIVFGVSLQGVAEVERLAKGE